MIEEEDKSMDFMYSNRGNTSENEQKNPSLDAGAEKKKKRARQSGAMEEEGILGYSLARDELKGFKEDRKGDDDYIEDKI